jgi:hypothetical protein
LGGGVPRTIIFSRICIRRFNHDALQNLHFALAQVPFARTTSSRC